MKMGNGYLLLLLASVIILTGCSRFFQYKFQVANRTGFPIHFSCKLQSGSEEFIVVNPEEMVSILQVKGFRCNPINCRGNRINTADSSLMPFIGDVVVYRNDSVFTTTNFNKEYHWQFDSQKRMGIYTANIREEDF